MERLDDRGASFFLHSRNVKSRGCHNPRGQTPVREREHVRADVSEGVMLTGL